MTFFEQIRRHSVALISLAVALTGLAYNTWRNELTEANRNVRAAGFALITEVARFQEVVFFLFWMDEPGAEAGPRDTREGWVHVLAIEDFSNSMPEPVPELAAALKSSWSSHHDGLVSGDAAAHGEIDAAIDELRAGVKRALEALD